MESLKQIIDTITPISDESWKAMQEFITLKSYKAKDIIISMDEKPRDVFFLIDGYARAYLINHRGLEYNKELLGPNEIIASFSAMMMQEESKVSVECLTDCKVYHMKLKDWFHLVELDQDINNLYIRVLERNFINLEQRAIRLSTMTATERYIALRERLPGIENKINQYHIASHLGITPIQMSRVRKKLFSK